MSDTNFGDRFRLVFPDETNKEIADKLGVTPAAVQNYKTGRVPAYETLLRVAAVTDCDLHWLLVGTTVSGEPDPWKEERQIENDAGRKIFDESRLADFIRNVVREEISKNLTNVQDLGEVDKFDLAKAIELDDNPNNVLAKWYQHDGMPTPPFDKLQFSGWSGLTLEEKVQQLVAARGIIDRQQQRVKIYDASAPVEDS